MKDAESIRNSLSKWTEGSGPYYDIVISSRIRLARNLREYAFPSLLSKEKKVEIINKVDSLIQDESSGVNDLKILKLDELPEIQKQVLVEKHLISPQHAKDEVGGKAVAMRDDESVAIMINEEDHLRIQSLLPGLQLQEAWDTATHIDDLLEKNLLFAFNEDFGYLTCCPTNAGTGLRASIMIHLPGLMITEQAKKVLNAMPQVGLAVRGLYGEGTEAVGNLFQVSNQITLGRSEKEIINNLNSVTKRLIEQERSAREMLVEGEEKLKLSDRVFRAYGILSNVRIINSYEALMLLSDLRLGIDLDIIKDVDSKVLNELMILIQPGFIQQIAEESLSDEERDVVRAELIRKCVRGEV